MTLPDSERILGLKIDVDTYQGMKKGVPRLLRALSDLEIKGTFFLSMGPDASGLALLQLIKNPLFLKKMLRTNAPGLYGLRTALYGTLLPSPMIALSFPQTVRQIMAEGHEVQFHAWDHRRWQDTLSERSVDWIRNWFDQGIAAFVRLTGHRPASFGAPAWRMDDRVVALLPNYSFTYVSCSRADAPFMPEGLDLPEIPSDLPCFEEFGVEKGSELVITRLDQGGIHCLPVHAEVEGGIWINPFIDLMIHLKSSGYHIDIMSNILELIDRSSLQRRPYREALLPGRATPCCV